MVLSYIDKEVCLNLVDGNNTNNIMLNDENVFKFIDMIAYLTLEILTEREKKALIKLMKR